MRLVEESDYALGAAIDPSLGECCVLPGGVNGISAQRQIVAAARQGLSAPVGDVLMTPLGGGALFADGLESGDTNRWSGLVP